MDSLESINLLGLRVSTVSAAELVNFILQVVSRGGKARAVYVNIHAINLAQDLDWYRDFVNSSDVVYCDGFGVKWGARLLGTKIPERLTPPDWISLLAAECARKHYSIFLLGAKQGVAEKMGVVLNKKYPGLLIAGIHHGYFDKSPFGNENEAVLQKINSSHADILLLGLGMPQQERWLMDNWNRLEIKVALPVGALFDYLSGELPRAPNWMTQHGLEWVGRLMYEPRRLWRRYLLGNPRFVWLVLKHRLGLGAYHPKV